MRSSGSVAKALFGHTLAKCLPIHLTALSLSAARPYVLLIGRHSLTPTMHVLHGWKGINSFYHPWMKSFKLRQPRWLWDTNIMKKVTVWHFQVKDDDVLEAVEAQHFRNQCQLGNVGVFWNVGGTAVDVAQCKMNATEWKPEKRVYIWLTWVIYFLGWKGNGLFPYGKLPKSVILGNGSTFWPGNLHNK